jgi:hypothetical protein
VDQDRFKRFVENMVYALKDTYEMNPKSSRLGLILKILRFPPGSENRRIFLFHECGQITHQDIRIKHLGDIQFSFVCQGG